LITCVLVKASATNALVLFFAKPIITGNTGLYLFGVSGNSGVQPIITFSGDDMYSVMGFAKNSTNAFVAEALTSTQVIKCRIKI